MKRVFFRTCLFLLASIFLFENAGFITHELALAAGLVFLAALVISYLPLKTERASVPGIALGVILMIVAVAAMPGEFLRPGALALFLLGTSLLVRGFNGEAPELPLFSVTAAGYGLYMFLSRADVHVWRWVKSLSFAFSNLVAALTAALPGTKALLGPAFIGAGVIVTFALLFIVGSFFLKENRLRKAAKALGAMVLIIAIYAVAFTYAPSAFKFQIKMGPTPSEEEKSTVRQASEQYYGKHLEKIPRLETEKQTKIIFSADTLIVDHCALWAPFALGLLFLLPTYYFFKGAELHAIPLSSSTLFSAGGVVLLFAMALGETSHLRSGSQEELKKAISEKRVGFYMHGFANWMRPSFKSFGSRSSGMFGNLPDFVESMGFRQPAPDLEPNGRNRQIPLPARNEALRRLNIEKEKPKRPTRDQNAYIDSGALLTEITPQTLEGVDVLMLLNINGLLNSEDPTRLPYHSPMQRARTALWKRYEQISKQIDAIRREDFPARVKQLTAKDEKAAEQQKELIKQARAELKVLEQQLTAPVDETPTITMQQTGMQMQLDKLAEQLADLRGQVKNARGEIDVPTEDQIQRRARLLEEQGALRDDQATMMPKMIELATMRNELQTKRNDLARRRRELAKRARELDKSELAALEQELDQAKKELDEREKERQSNYGDTEQDWQQLRVSQVALITQMETLVNEERKLALPRTTLENQLEALVRQQEQLAGKNEDLLSTKAELDPGGKKLRELADLVKPQSGPTDLQEVFELPKKLDELEKRLISLQERWHKDALEVIWDFVADGGALLVIGDHTFYKETELPVGPPKTELWLNKVLEPFDIKFANDSAKYFVGGWLQSMENPLHFLTHGLRDDQNEVGMVVGASLVATGAARPVIVGKYGYLDAGDMREGTRGYLGNMDYDMGEPLGQIVIAAEQDYGKGKVLVFGDTSAFANGIITNTGEFCNRVFTWLASETSKPNGKAKESANGPTHLAAGSGKLLSYTKTLAAILLLVGAIACFRLSGGYAGVVAGALVVGLVVAAHSTNNAVPLGPGQDGSVRLAYVDNYHMPKVSKEGWRDDGLMALHLNLMRNGFYTQNLKKFDLETLQGADLVVTVAPSAPFTRKDVEAVERYLEGGGTMILTASHEDLDAIQKLLDAFDLRIPFTPLGRFKIPVAAAAGKFVPFWRVWPIEYLGEPTLPRTYLTTKWYGELPVKEDYDTSQILIPYEPTNEKGKTGQSYDLAVRLNVGKGKLILIADSGFWMNKNLEIEKMNEIRDPAMKKNYMDSIYFMQWMLQTHVPQTKESN